MSMNKKFMFGTLGCAVFGSSLYAADHGDTPQLIQIGRNDARISDHHAWQQGSDFVMSLCTNPAIPATATSYRFPEDLTLRMHIDNESTVDFTQSSPDAPGRIVSPEKVNDRITFEFAADENGNVVMHTQGLTGVAASHIRMFAGLRDDPFINGDATNVTAKPSNRVGRNSACIVLQMPLADIRGTGQSLLTWATAKVPDINGPIQEHAGRALRSQVAAYDSLNTLRPRAHWTELGLAPDVMIHNLGAPSHYPNGRLLTDDVIDLVVDTRGMKGNPFGNPDARDATENDVPFLADFPYLAPPH
jgi:hypothetical protein